MHGSGLKTAVIGVITDSLLSNKPFPILRHPYPSLSSSNCLAPQSSNAIANTNVSCSIHLLLSIQPRTTVADKRLQDLRQTSHS
jgi:hypothetical protein